MVISTSLLLATCVGCQPSSVQPAQLPPAATQPEATPSLSVPTQPLMSARTPRLATPDTSIAVEWSARSRESSPGAVLKRGSRGAVVTRLQARLARLGYAVNKIDGIFGPQTQARVMQFQQAYGLMPDGVVDASIWAKLNRDIAHSGRVPGQSQRSLPLPSIAPVAKTVSSSLTTPSAALAASPVLTASADRSLFTQKTAWIAVLVIIQGAGWLVVLQGLNKELVLLTGRSLFPDKTKQWLFSAKQ